MVKTCLGIALSGLCLSCGSEPTPLATEPPKDTSLTANNAIASNDGMLSNPVDSLRNPSNFFYLSDLPTRTVGELILKDSIKARDNEVSFRCLDSLNSNNAVSRAFYFQVFKKIISNTDGALSEVVGEYSKKYIETYPKEFANYASGFSKTQMELWAFQTVEHVLSAIEEKSLKDADEWTNKLTHECNSCDASQLKALKNFNSLILQAAKDRDDKE